MIKVLTELEELAHNENAGKYLTSKEYIKFSSKTGETIKNYVPVRVVFLLLRLMNHPVNKIRSGAILILAASVSNNPAAQNHLANIWFEANDIVSYTLNRLELEQDEESIIDLIYFLSSLVRNGNMSLLRKFVDVHIQGLHRLINVCQHHSDSEQKNIQSKSHSINGKCKNFMKDFLDFIRYQLSKQDSKQQFLLEKDVKDTSCEAFKYLNKIDVKTDEIRETLDKIKLISDLADCSKIK